MTIVKVRKTASLSHLLCNGKYSLSNNSYLSNRAEKNRGKKNMGRTEEIFAEEYHREP